MQCVIVAYPSNAHVCFALKICNSYTMGCPPVRGPLATGLSYVHVDTHGINILYHLYQCRPCTSRVISCLSWYRWDKYIIHV